MQIWFARLLQVQALRFLIVGGASAATYLAAMTVTVEMFAGSTVAAAVVGFMAGTAVSYLGNSLWTFRAPMSGVQLGRFVAVTGAGLLLNFLISFVLSGVGLHYLAVGAVILVVVPCFNYICHRLWTYGSRTAHMAGETRDC